MSEEVEDVLESMMRQSLVAGSQLAEQLARARQQFMRAAEQRSEQANVEAQRALVADRAVMQSVLSPTTRDDWWEKAQPEQIAQAHILAEAWKDYDPAALEASVKITSEVKSRYGIDTADMQGDSGYMKDYIAVAQRAEAAMKEAKEHAEAMALVEAAQAEQINRYATELKDELERHSVPPEYLANPDLVTALQASKEAAGTDAAPDADRVVAERMHLIDQDGINGPSLEDLRQEIGQNYSGTDDAMFADAAFVATARDWHEAKTLAEGGFVDKGNTGLEARYENAEKELFTRIAPMGQEIQDKVLQDPNTKTTAPAVKTEKPSVPAYGSAEHYAAFETSLQGTGTDAQIKGRVAAARGQATPPRAAVEVPKKAPKARKASAGAGVGRERTQSGPSR
ncbi:hypothetical protein FQ154_18530 [Paeniglutamicibacter gangotriensis]|uniref:Uncharacterized protein n=1 Tax=Paeniglutamicibacter gangotriensis TaxID=254787 RepID=A0A5B0E3D1_9MICC|nr:hypothetical protein [Paeniglutamicibacter gangotriensis]KAA0973373.1 hypothetical protein FQ154_18530 [Paeniglutamicibacter gangotriensis]